MQERKGEDGTEPVEWDDITKTAQAIMEQWAPEQKSRPNKPYISEATWKLIKHRDEEMRQGNTHEASGLNKQIQKLARQDREKWLLQIEATEDVRDAWLGLKTMKKHYVPRYYEKADQAGSRIKPKQHAEAAAKYLAETQWGNWEREIQDNQTEPLHTQGIKFNKYPPRYNAGRIKSTELDDAIHRTKKHKAPGPDGIPAEFFKLLDFKSRTFILELFNSWFSGEQKVPSEAQLAKVILIHKKGNPALFENYRPISLLNNCSRSTLRFSRQDWRQGWNKN
jgi:hypothetical protein